MSRARYEYRAVSLNGAGVYGPSFRNCASARRRAAHLAEAMPLNGPFEVERVLNLLGGGHRYWMRRRSRWVPWAHDQDADARQPDWIYGEAAA